MVDSLAKAGRDRWAVCRTNGAPSERETLRSDRKRAHHCHIRWGRMGPYDERHADRLNIARHDHDLHEIYST